MSSFFPGTVSHNYQQKGEQYNDYLAQVKEQHALGWNIRKGWLAEPVVNQTTPFKVKIEDRDGKPVSQANIEAQFLRPSDKSQDHVMTLVEKAPGEYENKVSLPLPGRWDVVLKIRKQEQYYDLRASTSVSAPQ